MPQQDNSTANIVMVILLVIVVGFVVWFFTNGRAVDTVDTPRENSNLEINVGGGAQNPAPAENQ